MFIKYSLILILSILAMPALAASSAKAEDHHKGAKIILHFKSMFGVDAPFLSTPPPDANPPGNGPLDSDPKVRDVLGDYQSWKIAKSVDGKLFSDGKLIINIKGLIFGNGSPNDEDHFRVLVSCQTAPDSTTNTPFSNVITDPFPVHKPIGKGNANIKVQLENFPSPCLAPAVMILNGDSAEGDVWFAVTGF